MKNMERSVGHIHLYMQLHTSFSYTHTCTHTSPLSLQVMVNSEVSGVAFSRHPLTSLSSNTVLVEAVYGLGEGLVSGELEADRIIIFTGFEICPNLNRRQSLE